ncbi:MAG: SDR family oxidoreductase [Verrucomicrobiae bacterium]|nr:SDR family oxidoreductase [Verrucomicrobiae bacterium]
MSAAKTLLLTGFTGVLGKRFACRLAQLGHEIYCPIRAGDEAELKSRFAQGMQVLSEVMPGFSPSLEQRIHPVFGDVREKALGLPAATIAELTQRGIAEIWHLAALLDLTESNSQDVYDTNLVGSRHVLDFAREQRVPELHYFSTFGASGEVREGIAREIVGIRPPSFRNTYERTKWEAERHVWQAQIRGELRVSIYRPSIIVGDSVTGRYEQFNVFNHPFDMASRLRRRIIEREKRDPRAPIRLEVRVPGRPEATLNIVPLDYVLDVVMALWALDSSRGRVYHVTNTNPPTLAQGMEMFTRIEPWEGARWELIPEGGPYLNVHEKFISKQLAFLAGYLRGEAIYDISNVRAVLAQHGGVPQLDNRRFLTAIARRALERGWQEAPLARAGGLATVRESLDAKFQWPEGEGHVVDFSPHHPLGGVAAPPCAYSLTDRLISKAYRAAGRVFSILRAGRVQRNGPARDLVLAPFGMGVTRRGEAEGYTYSREERLCDEVFARMNQVVGFDLRAFAREPIPGHEDLGDVHDHSCWATADNLAQVLRFFQDVRASGGVGLVPRMQILPHSAGTNLAGWLAGVMSFHDMALMAHHVFHQVSECERQVARAEVERWFGVAAAKVAPEDRAILDEMRRKVDPAGSLALSRLARHFHGRLELVFTLNARMLRHLQEELRRRRIAVAPAITLSPNSAVFAGNALEIEKLRRFLLGWRRIEMRGLPLEVSATPHCERLRDAHRPALEVLEEFDRQGCLRDPVVPVVSYNGEMIRTRREFIEAVAGIGDRPARYDRMIEKTIEEGGRHFLLVQSGFAGSPGDFFEGVIRNAAGAGDLRIHRPHMGPAAPQAAALLLDRQELRRAPGARDESIEETMRWYEQELAGASGRSAA